jgi:hypothetical protein
VGVDCLSNGAINVRDGYWVYRSGNVMESVSCPALTCVAGACAPGRLNPPEINPLCAQCEEGLYEVGRRSL